ncbi:MAG: hypothetical protein R2788_19585 [Saprospiraceae bacterium]
MLTEMIHNVVGQQKGVSIFCGIGERRQEGKNFTDMKDAGTAPIWLWFLANERATAAAFG